MNDLINVLKQEKLIAILRGVSPDQIIPVVAALKEGGIRFVEVTFDQSASDPLTATSEAIRTISQHFNDIYLGAGTVMTMEQLEAAAKAGAQYIISPDLTIEIVQQTVKMGLVSMPGALTPTEISIAHAAGATFVKVFPAGELGPGYIKAIKAPLNHIPLLAVGSITYETIPAFIQSGIAGFGLGGNLVDRKLIAQRDYIGLTANARRFVERIQHSTKL